MPTGNQNNSTSPPVKLKQYAASGSVRDLVTDSPDGKTCARMLTILGAGSYTSAKDSADALMPGTTPGTLGPFPVGKDLLGNFSSVISADAAFIASW